MGGYIHISGNNIESAASVSKAFAIVNQPSPYPSIYAEVEDTNRVSDSSATLVVFTKINTLTIKTRLPVGASSSSVPANRQIVATYDVSTVRRYFNSSIVTFAGDGSTTSFKIAHGLVAAPSKYFVQPLNAAAKQYSDVSADATDITITFGTAPASNTTLKFYWYAEV